MPREVPGLTIDDKSTRDIDDATSIERTPDGWKILVSIADVGRLVRLGSDVDNKAKDRVATRYYASGNSPMLPRFLAERQLSLWPNKPRDVLVVDLTLGENLTTTKAEIYEGTIRSQAKLSYEQIPGMVDNAKHPFHSFATNAKKLALGLLTQRRAQGAFVLYDLNNGWVSTEEGFLKKLENKDAVIGYIIIQELMIRANAEVAKLGAANGVPLLYRNHETKDAGPELEALAKTIQEGFNTPIEGLDELRKKTHRLLEKAVYSSKLVGHYGLNLPAYLHFTSPIRRYADLVNHRQIRAMFRGEQPPYTIEQIEEVAQHINTKTLQERQGASEHFKGKAEDKAQRAIDARRLDGLSAKEFERVVKVETRRGEDAAVALLEAYERRLFEGTVPLLCMTVVLGEAPEGPNWEKIKALTIRWLAKHPEDAVSILAQGTQIVGWASTEYDTESSGPDHLKVFQVTAHLDDNRFTVRANVSKEAKQKASVGLLALLGGVEPPVFEEPKMAIPEPAPPPKLVEDKEKNPVSLLQEHAQQGAREAPVYMFKQQGPSHLPVISCTCKYLDIEKVAVASSKKEAKRLAAQAVVQVLDSPR